MSNLPDDLAALTNEELDVRMSHAYELLTYPVSIPDPSTYNPETRPPWDYPSYVFTHLEYPDCLYGQDGVCVFCGTLEP